MNEQWIASLRAMLDSWAQEDREASAAWEQQVELEREQLEQRRREQIEKAMRERKSATIH